MVYHVGSEHDPSLDAGIAWDSFGASWPTRSPILSARDAALPRLAEFDSPFSYAAAGRESE
jgi:dTDP-4-dehydrorhamnose 3,5-epimerase